MGTAERRSREREKKRTLILDAAREMFAADGIEAVTMRAIADRIEYTPTTIYHHFRDKHALIQELCARDFRAFAHTFASMGRIDDPGERLRRIGLAYVRFALEHPGHYRFMFMTPKPADAYEELDDVRGNPQEDAYAMLRDTVAEGIAAGRFRPELADAEQLAQIMWASVHGIASLHIAKGVDSGIAWRDAQETTNAMIDILVRGTSRGTTSAAPGTP